MARLADGAVLVQYGGTAVLATVVASKEANYDRGYFPLFVEYREKSYAAGKIPGGFFKREGRPGEKEILSARQVDRPIRPLFPEGYMHEVQVICSVVSFDQENDPDVLALIGASAALSLSDIPWAGPVAAVRIGRADGRLVVNPTLPQIEAGDLELVVAGTRDSIVMVEGGANEVSEADVLEAMRAAHVEIARICELQERIRGESGRPKREFAPRRPEAGLEERVRGFAEERVKAALQLEAKDERQDAMRALQSDLLSSLGEERAKEDKAAVREIVESIEKREMRRRILEDGRRADGRGPDAIRPITCEIGVLPRTHGSALFTRGQTQSLGVVTLGTSEDTQMIDDLEEKYHKTFMLHYNFPPFSVGEVGRVAGPGRREIGHGALAERALTPLIPGQERFPYTLRIVSDILESNGSSSMATVCSSSLALMEAGVPIGRHCGGIAMGLIKEGDRVAVLSDILGLEDHLGDMDFKVAGTRAGITAVQMDIKIGGISFEILETALEKARAGRLHILSEMEAAIAEPRTELSRYAPRILSITINKDKIREVIGPGGKIIRGIVEQTGAKIDVNDDGTVNIASVDPTAGEKALEIIRGIVAEPEIGRVYDGVVKSVLAFGAFVEFMPGKDGLVHISELAQGRVEKVEDVLNVGDQVQVRLIGIDKQNRVKLSLKEAGNENWVPATNGGPSE
ncbi:MAG: polyribonucleotide nucleotidyltransferase, partial [Gemmatimonadetes bacterium]|nr:polyribonucleotide nucleotidyltransferase [Gemmatimonadota bacterium]